MRKHLNPDEPSYNFSIAIGTNWLKDSLGMLLKEKLEVGMVGTFFEFFPSLEGYRKQGKFLFFFPVS